MRMGRGVSAVHPCCGHSKRRGNCFAPGTGRSTKGAPHFGQSIGCSSEMGWSPVGFASMAHGTPSCPGSPSASSRRARGRGTTATSIGALRRRCFVSGGGCARASDGQALVSVEALLAIQAFEESAGCFANHDGNGGTFHGDGVFCGAVRTILIFETNGIRVQSCLRDLVLKRTPGAEMFGGPFDSIQFIWFLFHRRTSIPFSKPSRRGSIKAVVLDLDAVQRRTKLNTLFPGGGRLGRVVNLCNA